MSGFIWYSFQTTDVPESTVASFNGNCKQMKFCKFQTNFSSNSRIWTISIHELNCSRDILGEFLAARKLFKQIQWQTDPSWYEPWTQNESQNYLTLYQGGFHLIGEWPLDDHHRNPMHCKDNGHLDEELVWVINYHDWP